MATTQEVFDHHVEAFVARDVEMTLEDFTEGSLVIVNGETHEGLESIAAVFTDLFQELPADCHFELSTCIVQDRYVYIIWNAESDSVVYEFVTDTFLIEDGKISLQTVGAVRREK
jgi:uncharacterized protein (TIGR02246 family)